MSGVTVTQMYFERGIFLVVDREFNNRVEVTTSLSTMRLQRSVRPTEDLLTQQFIRETADSINEFKQFVEAAAKKAAAEKMAEQEAAAAASSTVDTSAVAIAASDSSSSADTSSSSSLTDTTSGSLLDVTL